VESGVFDEGGDRARARRGGAGGRKPEDVWADSSEEDEAYGNARRLLSQGLDVVGPAASGGNTHTHADTKGKARARG